MSKYVTGFEDVGAGGNWQASRCALVLGLAVGAALLGLPVSAALLPEVFLTSLFYTTHFYTIRHWYQMPEAAVFDQSLDQALLVGI